MTEIVRNNALEQTWKGPAFIAGATAIALGTTLFLSKGLLAGPVIIITGLALTIFLAISKVYQYLKSPTAPVPSQIATLISIDSSPQPAVRPLPLTSPPSVSTGLFSRVVSHVKGHPIKSALVGGALLAAVGFGLYSLWGSRATEVIIQQLPAPALPVGLLGAGSNVTDLSRLSDNCSLISRNWGSYVPAVVAAPIKGISHLLTSFNTTSPSLPIDANCPVSLNETSSSNSSGLFSYTNSTSHPLGLKGISQPVSNLAPHQVDANCPVSLNKTSSSNSYGLFSYTNSTSHPLGLGGIYQPVSSLVPHQKIFYRLSSFIDSSPKLAKTSSIDPKSLSRALNIPLFSSAMNQMSQFKHVATKCGNLGLVLFENVLNMASFGGRVIVTIGLFGAPHVMTEVNAVAESVFFVGKKALSFAANQSLNRLKEGGQSIRSISSYVGSGISKVYSRISSLSQALVVGEKKIPCDPSKKNDCVQSKLKEIEEKGLQEKKLQDCIPFAGEAECKKCIIDRNIDSCDFVAIMGP